MFYLTMSILTNAAIFLIFKLFDRFNVQTLQAIVVNYFVAFSIGIMVIPNLGNAATFSTLWS